MKSGTFTNNTLFTASAAQVNVPTGSISVYDYVKFTVPTGVKVINVSDWDGVYDVYVGVTPNTTHELSIDLEEIDPGVRMIYSLNCRTHDYKEYISWDSSEYGEKAHISWSPEINKQTPSITDY